MNIPFTLPFLLSLLLFSDQIIILDLNHNQAQATQATQTVQFGIIAHLFYLFLIQNSLYSTYHFNAAPSGYSRLYIKNVNLIF